MFVCVGVSVCGRVSVESMKYLSDHSGNLPFCQKAVNLDHKHNMLAAHTHTLTSRHTHD